MNNKLVFGDVLEASAKQKGFRYSYVDSMESLIGLGAFGVVFKGHDGETLQDVRFLLVHPTVVLHQLENTLAC